MAITLTYGGLNINDGTTYKLLDGFDPGEKLKSYEEARSYSGTVAQYNVTEANLIEVTVPLLIKADTLAHLHDAIDALNVKVDAGAQDLVFNDGTGAATYSCVESPRVHYFPSSMAVNRFQTLVTMTLYRTP